MGKFLSFTVVVLMTSFLMGCPPPPPPPAAVDVVVQSQALNANGLNILMVYETTGPMILAHVEERQELKDPASGQVVRIVTLDYWEWFTPQLLPAGAVKPINMPQAEWNAIRGLRGKTIVLSDRIQAGPFLVTGLGAFPDPFQATITRKHTLYTGSQLQGQGGGKGLDLGRFGFLQTDANNGNPSMTQTDTGPPVANADLTPAWRQNKTIQGNVVNVGVEQAAIEIKYESGWQTDPAAPGTFGVDWRIQLDITGSAQQVVMGSDSGKRPSDRP